MRYFKQIYFVLFFVTYVLLAACSSLKTYPNSLEKNLTVVTKTDSSVDVAVDVFQVKPDCSVKYAGTVQLDEPSIEIGIPSGRSSYLAFVFASSGFFSATTSTSYDALLRPRKGHTYTAKVTYFDDIYNVVLLEKSVKTKKTRVVEAKELSTCRPL